MTSSPNILWICTDQQRYDTIHALGYTDYRTPNIDRLCAEGTAFTHAHCQSPICTPSRASFLSGAYPGRLHNSRNGNAHYTGNLPLTGALLKDSGYTCGLSGKLHLASPWADNGREVRANDGYDFYAYSHDPFHGDTTSNDYLADLNRVGVLADVMHLADDPKGRLAKGYQADIPPEHHQTSWCVDKALEFIDAQDGPWMFSLNMFDPHPAFDAPLSYRNRYDASSLTPPLYDESDDSQQRKLSDAVFQEMHGKPGDQQMNNKAHYCAMVELIDDQVGRLLDYLDQHGQRENTLIIFMSDHGEMLGDHGLTLKGCRFYEGLVRVPLIFSMPGTIHQGKVCNGLVELVDVLPTLADFCEFKLNETHGKSLTPTLTGDNDGAEHRSSVRCEYYDALNFWPSTDESGSYATMFRNKRYKLNVYHSLNTGELYDLKNDPDEYHDLWEDPDHQDIKTDLMQSLFNQTVLTQDRGAPIVGPY